MRASKQAAEQEFLKEFWKHMKRSLAIALTLGSGMFLSAAAQTPTLPAAPSALAAPAAAASDAAPAAPAGPAKIAVIAFQVAVAQTNEGQRNFADLEKKFDPKRQQLKTLSDQIDGMTKDLQTKGTTLTDAERASRSKEIDTKKKQLDRDAEDARNDFQQQMQDLYQGLASKVYDVMQSYAEKEGYTLVLDVSEQQSPVLFASTSTNITKQVIDAYNVKSGVPAPPPQASGDAPVPAPKPAAPGAPPTH
jgi:outer membrane protein